MPVTLGNNDLERISELRASGHKWREIQADSERFSEIPLQSLWKMWKRGEVMPKYRRKDKRGRRYRVTVDAETHARIRRLAAERGVTMGEVVAERFTQDAD